MSSQELRKRAHDLDVTVWVGKGGIGAVTDELRDQLKDRDLVKVKFLRSSRGGTMTEALADDLANEVNADVFDVRGHTAVMHK